MMKVETTTGAPVLREVQPGALAPGYRVGLFLLFMAVGFVVFAVGHSAWIPYEWRLAARAGLSLVFLATTIGLADPQPIRR